MWGYGAMAARWSSKPNMWVRFLLSLLNQNMGQLEAYGVNEMYLSGMMTGLCGTYIAEEHESDSFESFKSYVYSSAVFMKLKKVKKLFKAPLYIITKDGAKYRSWSVLI